MELKKIGERTYYIENPTNIGIYKIDDKNVYIIDSGNDKDAGRKILKIINEQDWKIKGIINTHSNADHIGGNRIIQDRTNCEILANNAEISFIKNPILESSFLYGGFPFKDLRNKFLFAKESDAKNIEGNLPNGLEYFELKGHFFDMIGIKTSDNVYFLGDSLFSEETITKYQMFYIYDVKEYLNTLNRLENLQGNWYVPSHCKVTNDISELIKINRNKIIETINKILDYCREEQTYENILKKIFDDYNLVMNANQFVLIGNCVRSYLSYLYDEGKIGYEFKENKMFWKSL